MSMHTITPRVHGEASTCSCQACAGLECLERPRYFAGQLLTEAELNGEQLYLRSKNRLHNRYLHGWGVVCGLEVVCHECQGWVTVKQGYAIDPCGEDIVLCRDEPVDVVELIRKCKDANRKRRSECDPIRPAPPSGCQDIEERWCLALSYKEQESRPTTVLRRELASTCDCGGNGCSNGNGGNGRSQGCGCRTTAEERVAYRPTTRSAGTGSACQPTRVLEGYCLEIIPAPQGEENPEGAPPGTLQYELERCQKQVSDLQARAPDVTNMNPNQAYRACCQYRDSVQALLTREPLARCELQDELTQAQCPPPPQPGSNNYLDVVNQVIQRLKSLLATFLIDCLCMKLLPPCPPGPPDDRLILACLTVRDCKIVHICHFEGRRQAISLPGLAYWLGGLPQLTTTLGQISSLCCGEFDREILDNLRRAAAGPSVRWRVPGLPWEFDPDWLTEVFASFLRETVGADVIASVAPEIGSLLLNTRHYIGRRLEVVRSELRSRRVEFVEQPADAWTEEMVAASARSAPAAARIDEPLVVYTRGEVAVGFGRAPEGPAAPPMAEAELAALREELADLRGEVETLRKAGPEKPRGRRK